MAASGSVILGRGTGQRLAEQKHSSMDGWSRDGVSNALPPSLLFSLVSLPPLLSSQLFPPHFFLPPRPLSYPRGSLVGTYWSVRGTADMSSVLNCNYFSSIGLICIIFSESGLCRFYRICEKKMIATCGVWESWSLQGRTKHSWMKAKCCFCLTLILNGVNDSKLRGKGSKTPERQMKKVFSFFEGVKQVGDVWGC